MAIKQVIVWRQDLQGVPLGKKLAQAGHSTHLFLTERIKTWATRTSEGPGYACNLFVTDVEMDWINGNYRKVAVFVRSEEELMVIYNKAKELGLTVELVIDDGLTVFKGQRTITCLAIGPDYEEKIDQVTGEAGPLGKLRLL